MFRVQNNVPEVYVKESRDFQLLCRLIDCWHSGSKFKIDSVINSLEPLMISDTLLELLATRVGFFPRIQIDSNVLRYIVAAFPYIIKNKGTEEGVRAAINAILKAENDPRSTEEVLIEFTNKTGSGDNPTFVYNVSITTQNNIYNKAALREVLRYVLPFGYTYTLSQYGTQVQSGTELNINSDVSYAKVTTQRAGSVRSSNDGFSGTSGNLIGTYNTTVVVGKNDMAASENGTFPNDELGEKEYPST